MPTKKELPKNPSFELQRDLLLRPDTNPTNYIPFEDATAHDFVPDAIPLRVNAWWLADASWIAYVHDAAAVRKAFAERAGLPSCELIAGGGTECYVAHRDRLAIVTFRGTQSDAWDDLFNISRFAPARWDVGHVHEGFGKALDVIWKPLERALDGLPGDCRVWFTGHSLGGALASLAAVRRDTRAAGLYTFGSPRVGDGVFAGHLSRVFTDRSVRYVNDHDGVTHVPPAPFGFPFGRYTHVESLRWINKDGQVSTVAPTVDHFMLDVFGNTGLLLDVVELAQERRITLPDTLTDHTPLYYALHTWNDFAVNGEVALPGAFAAIV
jgi:triacylglycerol lipase